MEKRIKRAKVRKVLANFLLTHPSFIAKHDIIRYGISLWSVVRSREVLEAV